MDIVTVKNLTKDYTTNGIPVHAVRGVDLVIGKGEFTAIAGPSGSGKTTLLNIIGGLDQPSSGTISIAGEVINEFTRRELSELRLRKIGFIFQAYNLIPVLTALENVEYVLLLQGAGKVERTERSMKILGEVGLSKEAHRRPHELSGGQQQRVAVARAIVSEPELVLADEPTANLDQKTGAALLDLMHRLNQSKQITFLFSSHDSMVMERAERLINLSDGLIVSEKRKRSKKKTVKKKIMKGKVSKKMV